MSTLGPVVMIPLLNRVDSGIADAKRFRSFPRTGAFPHPPSRVGRATPAVQVHAPPCPCDEAALPRPAIAGAMDANLRSDGAKRPARTGTPMLRRLATTTAIASVAVISVTAVPASALTGGSFADDVNAPARSSSGRAKGRSSRSTSRNRPRPATSRWCTSRVTWV